MPRPPHLLAIWLLLLYIGVTNALHFYLDADEKRCFLEEVPSDTVVEGQTRPRYASSPCRRVKDGAKQCIVLIIGSYKALEWSEQEQRYIDNPELNMQVIVVVSIVLSFTKSCVVAILIVCILMYPRNE